MNRLNRCCTLLRCAPLLLACLIQFVATAAAAAPPETALGARPAWKTSRITGSPEPPLPYTTEPVFASLTFHQCLDISHAPGTDRLFIVEQTGKIFSFPNRPDIDKADLVVDLAKELPGVEYTYAIAFHPQFERNRYCYVCYIKASGLEDGTHVARFTVSAGDPPTIDVASEKTIITWLSGGHNGCCLKFGPDGCLYISTGDGVGPNPPDTLKTGQDVSDLLSSILRIDVDHEEHGQGYRIPSDNPFVDQEGVRAEVWAYGFRNPWRMSFDKKTGDLWVGDVGWELWELLDCVQRGGNYGWSVMEGRQPTNPEWPRGPTPILPPTIEHPHSESSSITDGLTYYGQRLQALYGHHVYGDYDTGKIWGFRYQDGQVVDQRELADTTHRIVGFGEDHSGELYLLDHTAGTIHRLIPNPQRDQPSAFPRKLSETGLFESLADLQPAPGVVAYSINAPPWSDHAVALRHLAVPQQLSVQAAKEQWSFPKDSVLAKTLSLDLEQGDLRSRRKVETQILHFDGVEWQPYTYEWNDDQTDARLLDAAGGERIFEVIDPQAAGGKRRQTWRFSGRAECQRCHNKWSGPVLAFNTVQLNKLHDFGGSEIPQLEGLLQLGLLETPIPDDQRPRLADPHDASAPLDDRARAYLHTNCAHCHRLHAGGSVLSKMQFDLPLDKTDLLGARPTQGTFAIHGAQVVSPGDPFRSVLFYRMAKLGGGRMPHLGSTEVDREGVRLISLWIQGLPANAAEAASGEDAASKLRTEETQRVQRLRVAVDESERDQLVESLMSTTSGALRLLQDLDSGQLPPQVAATVVDVGSAHEQVNVRDLFERFLPPEQRVRRLGSIVQAEQILALPGDADRGRRLFLETEGVQCKNCHRVQQQGKELGPDLSTIGRQNSREQLLESILEPSKRIDPKFVSYLLETDDGRVITGLLVSRDEREIVLKDAQNMELRFAADHIERLVPQQPSLMPELLFRDMTAQQLADLIEFLGSLK
jgi:uncharacterized repeat protein (TIGR03806 family)